MRTPRKRAWDCVQQIALLCLLYLNVDTGIEIQMQISWVGRSTSSNTTFSWRQNKHESMRGQYFTMSRNVLTFLSRSPNGKKSKLNREERNNEKTNYGCIDKLKEKVSDAKQDKLSDFAMRRTRNTFLANKKVHDTEQIQAYFHPVVIGKWPCTVLCEVFSVSLCLAHLLLRITIYFRSVKIWTSYVFLAFNVFLCQCPLYLKLPLFQLWIVTSTCTQVTLLTVLVGKGGSGGRGTVPPMSTMG